MTETREQRRTRVLQEVLPLYKFAGLQVDELADGARCSVPLSRENTNHVGIMHAGILFTLAEATSAIAISVNKDLARHIVIAKHVQISFRRPATTRVHATAMMTPEKAVDVVEAMATDPKHAFDIEVSLSDDSEKVVAEGVCTFVLRPPPPKDA